jgi:hypothetical protein
LVLAALSAQDRRQQITYDRRGQHHDGEAVQHHADFGEQVAA